MTLTIGVDVGGTKIAAGVVDEEGRLIEVTRRETSATDPEKIETSIADAVRELRQDHEVSAIGVAAAGFVETTAGAREPPLCARCHARGDGEDAGGTAIVTETEQPSRRAAGPQHRRTAVRGEIDQIPTRHVDGPRILADRVPSHSAAAESLFRRSESDPDGGGHATRCVVVRTPQDGACDDLPRSRAPGCPGRSHI